MAGPAPETLSVTSPATGEAIGAVPVHAPQDVRAAVARARSAQAAWGALPPRQRGKALRTFRIAIIEHAEALAQALSRENGKVLQEALTHDIAPVADLLAYFESRVHGILAPQKLPMHFLVMRRSYLHCVPRGVVGVIGPWNFPFSIPMGDAVMALLAGNAVVLKPSEVTPLIALKAKALWDATCAVEPRLQPDLLQIVTGGGQTGAALCGSGVDQVMFTGSVPTGRKVAISCAEQLIPCVLELGGINPAIVTADCDLERTAHALVWGGFANSGQVCASISRVYVAHSIAEALTDRVVHLVKQLSQGDPLHLGHDLGAMTFAPQMAIGQRILDDTVQRGGRVRTGGKVQGRFFEPTVLDHVEHGWAITQDESFSPLLAFVTVKDEEEAIHHANDSDKGLMAYVFCGDQDRARRIADRMEAGTTMINTCLDSHAVPGTPWQGMKQSGLGEVHSAKGLRDLCQVRHVHGRNWVPWFRKELWWYPYSEATYKQFLRVMRLWWGGGMLDRLLRLLRR